MAKSIFKNGLDIDKDDGTSKSDVGMYMYDHILIYE
jgi:hypothetical protein